MDLLKANLDNLTGLWKQYGSVAISPNTGSRMRMNTDWPHRCWLDDAGFVEEPADVMLKELPGEAIVPTWAKQSVVQPQGDYLLEERDLEGALLKEGWMFSFDQVAMSLTLSAEHLAHHDVEQGLTITRLLAEEVDEWVSVCSDAFGYVVDPKVISSILKDETIQLLLVRQGNTAVATAILYKTGEVVGVHQVGVRQACQGQGVARRLMLALIDRCARWQGKCIVLQASRMGAPLYLGLGFEPLFVINNYQRV